MVKAKTEIHPVILILGIVIGVYLAYRLVVLLINLFVYLGYNGAFLFDNLLSVRGISPLIMWGFWGMLIGGCVGVGMAIRKFKLSGRLLFYPVGASLLFVTVMAFVNRPTGYESTFHTVLNRQDDKQPAIPQEYHTVSMDANMRKKPTAAGAIVSVVPAGSEVTVIERGFYDRRNDEWLKVRWQENEGYINGKLISTNYR